MSSTSSFHGSDGEQSSDDFSHGKIQNFDESDLEVKEPPIRDGLAGPLPLSDDGAHSIVKQNKKRKQQSAGQRHWKRIKTYYDDGYLQLFQQSTADLTSNILFDATSALHTTQNGAVFWTSREKNIFFDVLSRKDSGDLKAISTALETKSEAQVQAYLQLLQNGLKDRHTSDPTHGSILRADIPAAFEVSPELETHLDRCAEAIALYQDRFDTAAGEERFPDTWLIDADVAKSIDDQFDTDLLGEESDSDDTQKEDKESSRTNPAHRLFRLSIWVELAERIFMNPGNPRLHQNWREMADTGQCPSITQTALSNFHDIVLSLTRRLVQTSIWLAMSRVKTSGREDHQVGALVKDRDVKAALGVLNLKSDSRKFWADVARRCSLHIIDVRHQKGWQRRMLKHSEVEQIMSERAQRGKYRRSSSVLSEDSILASSSGGSSRFSDSGMSNFDDINATAEPDPVNADKGFTQDTSDADGISSAASDMEGSMIEENKSDSEDDAYAEALDKVQSDRDELELWKLLGRKPPPELELSLDRQVPSKPPAPRKSKQDLKLWREQVSYQCDWEAKEP